MVLPMRRSRNGRHAAVREVLQTERGKLKEVKATGKSLVEKREQRVISKKGKQLCKVVEDEFPMFKELIIMAERKEDVGESDKDDM